MGLGNMQVSASSILPKLGEMPGRLNQAFPGRRQIRGYLLEGSSHGPGQGESRERPLEKSI